MKKTIRSLCIALTICMMLGPAALADSISFDGTVGVSYTTEVYALIGGTVGEVSVSVGDTVSEGDTLATLKTTKVYAEESGTITGIFAEVGDSADTVTSSYGAVMYIEGESTYTISASTDNAYNTTENKFVHIGETVYLSCYSDGDHTGEGIITAIEGTEFTVEVTSGEFLVGETVNVYRADTYKAATRIGRGELTRKNPTAVTGTGSIVSIAVSDGDTVSRGDLLFETLDGSFDGLYMSGTELTATESGTIAQLNVEQGGQVTKDSVVAVIYPTDAMRIEAEVSESDLASINVGDPVTIELIWNQDDEVTYEGTITGISAIATGSASSEESTSSSVTYTVYIDFEPDENTRFGMSAIVTTAETEDEDEEEEVVEEEVVEEEVDEDAEE